MSSFDMYCCVRYTWTWELSLLLLAVFCWTLSFGMPVVFPDVIEDRVRRLEELRVNCQLMVEMLTVASMVLRLGGYWTSLVIWIVCREVIQWEHMTSRVPKKGHGVDTRQNFHYFFCFFQDAIVLQGFMGGSRGTPSTIRRHPDEYPVNLTLQDYCNLIFQHSRNV